MKVYLLEITCDETVWETPNVCLFENKSDALIEYNNLVSQIEEDDCEDYMKGESSDGDELYCNYKINGAYYSIHLISIPIFKTEHITLYE